MATDTALDACLDTNLAQSAASVPLDAAKARAFKRAFLDVSPAMFIGALDQTIVAAALPVIGRELSGISHIAWVVTAYLLAATIAAPLYGRLGDAFGRQRMLLVALAFFVAGSVLCATSKDFTLLVAARALQGLGGGGLMTLAQSLIGEVVSPKERGRFQGWFGALFALSSTVGPVIGGVLAEHAGWRSIFLINIPLGIVAAATALHLKGAPGSGKMRPDWFGGSLFILGTLALLVALSEGGTSWNWLSWQTGALLVVALLGYFALARVEKRSIDPLIQPDIVVQPVIWRASAGVLLFAAALFGVVINLPLYLQAVHGVSSATAGLLLIPFTLASVVVSTWTGFRVSATGRPKRYNLRGLIASAIGCFVLALTVSHGLVAAVLGSIVAGLGLGAIMPAAQTAVQWAAGSSRLGAATATLSFARSVGGLLGAAISAAAISVSLLLASAPQDLANALDHQAPASPQLVTAFSATFALLGILAGIGAAVVGTGPDIDLAQAPAGPDRANAK